MSQEESLNLVRRTFESNFDSQGFAEFIDRLLKNADFKKTFQQSGGNIRKAFQDKVSSFERIGQFTDQNGKVLDILIVNLKKETTLERGRTSLRNFAADYLQSDRGIGKSAVLVAYVSENKNDWRFSFVTLEKERELNEKGNYELKVKKITPARRYSFLVGRNENSHTAQKQFVDLLHSQSSPTIEQIEEAFNIEKVTKEFFARYKELFEKTRSELNSIIKENEKVKIEFKTKRINVDDFAKKLLGQIVFLYFLQKKGWFGVPREKGWGEGNKKFLKTLFTDKHTDKNFFNDYLEPLFYEVLAKPRDHDYYEKFDCKIPFLNGGLFEPLDDYDWVHIDIFLPDELFSNSELTNDGDIGTGILDVFDRYNFTVNEAEPLETEVAVDPEMLGKVFENLLPENERHGKGTYYTPRVIVAYMCQQSLINYLSTNLSDIEKADIEEFILRGSLRAEYQANETGTHKDKNLPASIVENAKAIDKLLADVKICDPAIGSGAFPVGLLQEIVKARETLISTENVPHRTTYKLKRHTIENSIYGVDLDSGAVEIAKLRLWLSLVVDEEDREKVDPLPNLDYKIMQGNSLLEEFRGISLVSDKLLEKPKDNLPDTVAELKIKIGEKSNEFFALYQKGASELIKRKAVEEEVKSLKAELDDLTKVSKKDKKDSPLLDDSNSTKKTDDLTELEKLHEDFKNETGRNEKIKLRQVINEKEHKIISEHLAEIEDDLQTKVLRLESDLKSEINNAKSQLKDYVETPKIRKISKELKAKQKELDNTQAAQAELAEMDFAKEKPFFLWKLQFSEIFRNEDKKKIGFDIVIANPPYLRVQGLQKTQPELIEPYRSNYRAAQGSFDIYGLFIERGFELLKSYGEFVYIVPHKFFQSAFGEPLREFLGNRKALRKIVRFGAEQVFENPTTYTCLLFLSRQSQEEFQMFDVIDMQNPNETIRAIADYESNDSYETETLPAPKGDNWDFNIGKKNLVLEQLQRQDKTLGDITRKIFQGIPTGSDKVFVLELMQEKSNTSICFSNALQREVEIENELLKPFLMGKDVHRYEQPNAKKVVIFPYEINDEKANLMAQSYMQKTFPLGWQYFVENKDILEKRERGRFTKNWHCFSRPQNLTEFEVKKILTPDICGKPEMTIDEKMNLYHTTTVYSFVFSSDIKDNVKYFLGIFNSKILWFFLTATGNILRGNYFRFKTNYLKPFPIPCSLSENPPTKEQQEVIAKIVEYILHLKPNVDDADAQGNLIISYFEQIIDALAYELYLTDEIHQAGKEFFAPLLKENLPNIEDIKGDKTAEITKIFERLFNRDHIIRQNIFFLDTIDSVRIIEGKE